MEGDDVVIAAAYTYEAPTTLDEAQELASQDGAVLLAGGQSLITELKRGLRSPRLVVDLRGIESLRTSGKDSWGAMVTLDELAACAPSALTDAIESIRDPQVRNRATIGGSVALVQQGADLPAVALALGAEFERPGSGEIITAVRIPAPAPGNGSAYEKLPNPGSGYAICGVAAAVTVSADGAIERASIGLAGAGPTAVSLAADVQGTEDEVAAVAAATADGLEFPSDLAAPADYRAHLTRVLTARALRRAIRRATEGAR